MIASLRKRVNTIKKDREHGAGWLAFQSLDILRETGLLSTALTSDKYLKEIAEVATALLNARPTMVSISNYIMQFKDELESTARDSKSLDNLKKRATAIARRLISDGETASSRAVRNAARLITPRSIVMTCSFSSDVCTALEYAMHKGVDFKVLAVASKYGRISYGEMTTQRLAKVGIVSRIIPDDDIAWHVARTSIILTGADAISLQGWMINGYPSYLLAVIARRKKVPFYSVCTSAKIDLRGFLAGLQKPEPGFDTVPLELLKGIVTDKGILQPDDLYELSMDSVFGRKDAVSH